MTEISKKGNATQKQTVIIDEKKKKERLNRIRMRESNKKNENKVKEENRKKDRI